MIKKIIYTLLSIIATLSCFLYFIGICFFQTHFKMGTSFNGLKCSFKTVEEVESLLKREMEGYALALETRNGGIEEITAEEAGLTFLGQRELLNTLNNQNVYTWFLPIQEDHQIPAKCYEIDEDRFEDGIANLQCMQNMVAPDSNRIETNGHTFQVLNEIKGTTLDIEKTKEVIKTALKEWRFSVNLEESGCYIGAEYTDKEVLEKQAATLNQMQDTILTYDLGDKKETVDKNLIYSEFVDDGQINRNKVIDWVSELSDKYDTVGKERKFVTYDERIISITGGDYGWKINVEKTAEELIKLMEAGTIDVIEPVYEQTAASRSSNDLSFSYLEIDSKSKTIVLYKEGKPIMQTTADFGEQMEYGCFKVSSFERETDGLEYFIGFGRNGVYKFNPDDIPLVYAEEKDNGIRPGCAAISEKTAILLFQELKQDWPVIVY